MMRSESDSTDQSDDLPLSPLICAPPSSPFLPPPPPPPPPPPNSAPQVASSTPPEAFKELNLADVFGGLCLRPESPCCELRGDPSVTQLLIFNIKEYSVGSKPPFGPWDAFIMFVEVSPKLQQGPTCGLLALSIVVNAVHHYGSKQLTDVSDLLRDARLQGISISGEMFNASHMCNLARQYLGDSCQVELHRDALFDNDPDRVWDLLLNNVLFLVPYDNYANNEPGLCKGHRAHWCVVVGCSLFAEQRFVCAVQGKSKKIALWRLDALAISNNQLFETSSKIEMNPTKYIAEDIRANLNGQCISIKFKPHVKIRLATCFDAPNIRQYFISNDSFQIQEN